MPSYPGVGERIGRFRILAQLGAGGMGVVYDALEENLERRVALKVIAPVYADDPDFRERFSREARSLASLDSPHVVSVYAHGEEDGYLYIATQLIPDGDLGQMVGRWGPAPLGKAAELVEQVAAGLADAHDAGLVHRDIKPANVLVRRRGEGASATVSAYLGDFGIARRIDSEATRVGAPAVGTPSYMAPELHHGAPAGVASDLYSLGCVLWVTLTGSPPYVGATEYAVITAHLQEPVPQVSGTGAVVEAINHVLRRSMAKAPAERYQRAADLRADLRRAASLTADPQYLALARPAGRRAATPAPASHPSYPPPVPPAPGPAATSQPRRRTALWVGVGAAAVLAIGGGVAAAVLGGGSDDPGVAGPGASPAATDEPTGPPDEPAFADRSPGEIIRAAQEEMQALDTVRISGDVVADGELLGVDLTITAAGDCDGTISSGGGSAQLRRIGADTWFLADEAFWIASTDATQGPFIASTVGERWVAVPAADAESFGQVCDLDELLSTMGAVGAGDVLGPGTVAGQDVVEVDTGGVTSGGSGVASVATADPHYLLALEAGDDGSFRFSEFDAPFSARAPAAGDVFDLEGFGG